MNKEIGGYFELELTNNGSYPHSNGICLNSGRNALEYILRTLPNITHIWIPYFTCEVILEPINKLGIPYSFYHINEDLELETFIKLKEYDYLLITNYFGIKDEYIIELSRRYGDKLIVDNAQAYYAERLNNIKTLYSPRKFVGIPDGGIAFIDEAIIPEDIIQDYSYNRCSHLLKRIDLGASQAYVDFKKNSLSLSSQPILQMSNLTQRLLSNINYESIRRKRDENFKFIHSYLSHTNLLKIPPIDTFKCAMVYPYFTRDSSLRNKLIDNKIYVAKYWPNVLQWSQKDSLEYELTENIIPIPIDQRYNSNDMNRIVDLII